MILIRMITTIAMILMIRYIPLFGSAPPFSGPGLRAGPGFSHVVMGPAGGSALLPVGQVSAPSWSPFPRPGGSVPRCRVQISFLERAQDASEIGLPISGASLHTYIAWQAVAKAPPLCNRFATGSPEKKKMNSSMSQPLVPTGICLCSREALHMSGLC